MRNLRWPRKCPQCGQEFVFTTQARPQAWETLYCLACGWIGKATVTRPSPTIARTPISQYLKEANIRRIG